MKITAKQQEAFAHYEQTIAGYAALHATNEGAVRFAFQTLLNAWLPNGWSLLGEQPLPGRLRADGVVKGPYNLTRGLWEAKDTSDTLEEEIRKKIRKGYPLTNIIFEDTRRAVLYQNRLRAMDIDLRDRVQLAALLTEFFRYEEPDIAAFNKAVDAFAVEIPDIATGLQEIITTERGRNLTFTAAFDAFRTLCRASIDPRIHDAALDEMLIQHLLTERLFRTIFNNPEFTRRNVIATEIERVITALTSKAFSRDDFLSKLDRYYRAIENAAHGITEWSDKQAFLNTVYERFFQGYSVRQADTHGIVYTPQEIVDFMCASVQEVLHDEFGTSLDDTGVVILDPATGTGNFIVNLLRRISPEAIERKYAGGLFANEIMLLPYYIASMNIEHAYYERTESYKAFDGLCFADTLDMGGPMKLDFMNAENTTRVRAEETAAVTVIVGNPPYNVGQRSENDNNKNRRYTEVDKRIRDTYAKDSKATLNMQLYDAYVKFFRWASDRLHGQDGIVCYVSNNSFVDQMSFDGMRRHLLQDFTHVWHLDLHGNVRQNPKLSGTTHNVFGIQVGVGITLAVKRAAHTERRLYYHRVPEMWRKTDKLAFLSEAGSIGGVAWREMEPNAKHVWRTDGMDAGYDALIPLGTKEAKATRTVEMETIFKTYSNGVKTNRDDWAYDFDRARLEAKMRRFIESYNGEVDRWKRRGTSPLNVDDFVLADETRIKWSSGLKQHLGRTAYADYRDNRIRCALYRPFTHRFLYFDSLMIDRPGQFPHIFPTPESERENVAISLTDLASEKPFMVMASNHLADLHLVSAGSNAQCFPLYTYNEDGSGRRENITDWAQAQFRARYGEGVTKRDIFAYVYALLHHPDYRTRYAENLRRELPRVPFVPDIAAFGELPRVPFVPDVAAFGALVAAGERLTALHLGYETAAEYPLTRQTAPGAKPSDLWHVGKMKLSPDKTAVIVNAHLTLGGVPPAAHAYRLGNRAALDWVIDQYQIKTDARSGITSDPNRPHDPEYIARLIGRVITVSVETVAIVDALPGLE